MPDRGRGRIGRLAAEGLELICSARAASMKNSREVGGALAAAGVINYDNAVLR